eukprot:TRINITY_DN7854_c0_g1_i1.p1 TRINITY_DN7854_c0_g1~~TRINITY_DN7854_c0_g1_i1.p1  ORF type:complete len:276 (-),score=38.16 TRINITY_DN7854_c0_g1_i1:229-1056(-)
MQFAVCNTMSKIINLHFNLTKELTSSFLEAMMKSSAGIEYELRGLYLAYPLLDSSVFANLLRNPGFRKLETFDVPSFLADDKEWYSAIPEHPNIKRIDIGPTTDEEWRIEVTVNGRAVRIWYHGLDLVKLAACGEITNCVIDTWTLIPILKILTKPLKKLVWSWLGNVPLTESDMDLLRESETVKNCTELAIRATGNPVESVLKNMVKLETVIIGSNRDHAMMLSEKLTDGQLPSLKRILVYGDSGLGIFEGLDFPARVERSIYLEKPWWEKEKS